jgi:anti-sigma regulatory factor (Ser/Thr protein kinase)
MSAPEPQSRIELELPAAHAYASVGRRVVTRLVEERGLPERQQEVIALTASELLSNAVDHGGGDAAMEAFETNARMELCFELVGRGWSLSVSDAGEGDAAKLTELLEGDPFAALEDERGRGLMLLRDMVDDLEVRDNSEGTGLTVIARVNDAWRDGNGDA